MARTPNPDTPAGRRILDTASDLFYARGIARVGVDLIADEAGTTKKTIYDRYGSKDALVAAYLQRRTDLWEEFCDEHLSGGGHAGEAARVLAVFDAARAWDAQWGQGCSHVRAHAEIAGTAHPGLAVLRRGKRRIHDRFRSLLGDRAGAELLAVQLQVLFEGATVVAAVAGEATAYDAARDAAATLLGA